MIRALSEEACAQLRRMHADAKFTQTQIHTPDNVLLSHSLLKTGHELNAVIGVAAAAAVRTRMRVTGRRARAAAAATNYLPAVGQWHLRDAAVEHELQRYVERGLNGLNLSRCALIVLHAAAVHPQCRAAQKKNNADCAQNHQMTPIDFGLLRSSRG